MYVTNFMRNYYGKYDPVYERENYTQLVFDSSCRIRIRWEEALDPHEVLDELEGENEISYGSTYDKIMSGLIPDVTPHWAEKMQLVWRSIPNFLEMFDDGKAVLVVRDPRSVLASFKEFTYAPEPRYLGAIFNALDSMQKGREYRQQLDRDQFYIVRYEDVVREPESTVKGLLNFLGLSTDHDLLSEEGWTDTSGDRWHVNSAFDEGESFDKNAAVHRWRGNLEKWELALCERVNGEMMEAYGYELSGVSVSESKYLDIIRQGEQIRSFFEQWKHTGEGVEQYPTDPTDPDNWAENN